jgi:hypothetical protein
MKERHLPFPATKQRYPVHMSLSDNQCACIADADARGDKPRVFVGGRLTSVDRRMPTDDPPAQRWEIHRRGVLFAGDKQKLNQPVLR